MENIRQTTIKNVIEPQRVYGPLGEKRTQVSAVKFMVDCCGLDVIKFYTGGNHKYALDPILKRNQRKNCTSGVHQAIEKVVSILRRKWSNEGGG